MVRIVTSLIGVDMGVLNVLQESTPSPHLRQEANPKPKRKERRMDLQEGNYVEL